MITTFDLIPVSFPDAQGIMRGRILLSNAWELSIVSGPKGSGVAGVDGQTWEVAVFNPNGGMLEDILAHQDRDQVSSILRLVAML
jgi:hypothetical protein